MMYLSKLTLSPRSRTVRNDEANPHAMHATLCWAFRKDTSSLQERGERGKTVYPFLWRLEPPKQGVSTLLVQSQVEPEWGALGERSPDYLLEPPQIKTLPLGHLAQGQILRFRLKANPTVTTRHKDRPDKPRRVGLYKPCQLLGYENEQGAWVPGWLERQADKNGFELLSADLSDTERVRFYKHKGGSPVTLQSALFDGYLRVTDLGLFKETLARGIGKAKGLGFGLLSVAKA